MVDIALFGDGGPTASQITAEASRRGHRVVSYASATPHKRDRLEHVDYRVGELSDGRSVAEAADECDVVAVAIPAQDIDGRPLAAHLPAIASHVAGNARLGIVGWIGVTLVDKGRVQWDNSPAYRTEWEPEARAHSDVLATLSDLGDDVEGLDWFYVTPAELHGEGARPGAGLHLNTADLVTKSDGTSSVTGLDFAIAFTNELEGSAGR